MHCLQKMKTVVEGVCPLKRLSFDSHLSLNLPYHLSSPFLGSVPSFRRGLSFAKGRSHFLVLYTFCDHACGQEGLGLRFGQQDQLNVRLKMDDSLSD